MLVTTYCKYYITLFSNIYRYIGKYEFYVAHNLIVLEQIYFLIYQIQEV